MGSITSAIVRRQSSEEPTLPWWTLASTSWPLELGQQLPGVLGVSAVAGGDDRALLGEASGDRGADAAGAARDEHDAPDIRGRR